MTSQTTPPDGVERCCGLPMRYQLIFNVLRYECVYRPGHEAVYHNTVSNLTAAEGEFPWHEQDIPHED